MSSKTSTIAGAAGSGTEVKKSSAWISARTNERGLSTIFVLTYIICSNNLENIALAQQTFASDPKYKKYTQQVEKCLNSFDNVHEWADCIAFLKQLLKVRLPCILSDVTWGLIWVQTFQSYMQFKEIPRKLIVAKRLAQCLNPALPTGVHQRALDVYAHILAVLGVSIGSKNVMVLY
jgi:hypothetical protein